ncbi:hypothetical protein [Geodermatophilus sp. CPCC 206100]|uniref:hypothetical protein n=1 Tax=Geodermatophilus sp. CPCC 206100 TaxID=3020054 RepID=UPI003AFFD375
MLHPRLRPGASVTPCSPRRVGHVAGALLGGALLLSACTGQGEDPSASPAQRTDQVEVPPSDAPSEQIDTVQTDAPVTTAALVLTFAEASPGGDSIEAAAFIQGAVEAGGRCVLTAEQDGTTLESDPSEPEAGPSTTECGALSIDVPSDAEGTWAVSVTYTSATTELTSETREVTL